MSATDTHLRRRRFVGIVRVMWSLAMLLLVAFVLPSSSTARPTAAFASPNACLPDDVACAIRELTEAVEANNNGQFVSTLLATLLGAAAAFLFSWLLARRERAKDEDARAREYDRARQDRQDDRARDREERLQDRATDRSERTFERLQAQSERSRQRILDREDAHATEMGQLWREYLLLLKEVAHRSRGPEAFGIIAQLRTLSAQIEVTAREADAAIFAVMYPRLQNWVGSDAERNRRRAILILTRYLKGELPPRGVIHEFKSDEAWASWGPADSEE